jgi:diaminopimelate epimerase
MVPRPEGQRFYKMTGSGNDFVVFESSARATKHLENAETITSLAARGTGIGADGVVFLEKAGEGNVRMRYYNSDGSEAALCGNASLCSTRLAVELGLAQAGGFVLHTAAGSLRARIRDNLPEVDLEAVTDVRSDARELGIQPGERRLGYTKVGVPHVVVEVPDIETIDVVGRGSELRHHRSLVEGANVNFVSRRPDGDFAAWGESGNETTLWTRSSLPLIVRFERDTGSWLASLRGEGRIVFEGRIRDLD